MKAMLMTATGGPEVLQLANVPEPEITSDTELLVRLKAAGVNPVDTKLRSKGTYYPDRLPAILGCDGAGVVEAVGAGVTRFRVGDEVYFCSGGIGGSPGNYAEYAVVDERFCAHKPRSLNFAEAAAAPLVLITAWESLHDRAAIKPDQTVLIHAGAGGVGHVAIQLAKLAGAQVCTTIGSREKADFVSDLGADAPILYKTTDFVWAVQEWTKGDGVDLALDAVGGDTFIATFRALRVYGDLVTLLQPGPDVDWKEARLRNLRVSYELMLTPMYYGLDAAREHQAQILEECARLFDEGRLRIHLAQTFPLEEAAAAHRLIEQGTMTGKIALVLE
ncbi:MAG: zinc-dependent alcohol dehydrogenase family protein [Gammaproteobacteria bacterium]